MEKFSINYYFYEIKIKLRIYCKKFNRNTREVKMKKIMNKYGEVILFGIVGVLTSIVNYFAYFALCYALDMNYLISNALSWVIAVLFSFFTNRYYVFKEAKGGDIWRNLLAFVYGRIFTGIVEMLLLFICVDIGKANDLIAKFLIGFFTAILNYFIGKIWVFKKGGK